MMCAQVVNIYGDHADICTSDGKRSSACAINLASSILRRAHKCHLEYLENMGVTASIAIAINVRDQLWGLVIGHHWSVCRNA